MGLDRDIDELIAKIKRDQMIGIDVSRDISPTKLLAAAVVGQAVDDYRRALRGQGIETKTHRPMTAEELAKDCEKFFTGEDFMLFVDIDGEYLMRRIRKEIEENETNKFSQNVVKTLCDMS